MSEVPYLAIITCGLVAVALFGGFFYREALAAFYYVRLKWGTKISREHYLFIHDILQNHIPFYRHLSGNGQGDFVNRVVNVCDTKDFFGRKGLRVTEEMMMVISAGAVQLTFGLDRFALSHFHTIYVFPDSFDHAVMKARLKGGTSPTGSMFVSWKHILHGFEVEDDKLNLGLHEMAHALKLQVENGYFADRHFSNYFSKWEEHAEPAFLKVSKGNGSIFRKYGGTNRYEFFSVAVEHFFEGPEEFLEEERQLFLSTCQLLKLNPLNTKGDYELVMEKK